MFSSPEKIVYELGIMPGQKVADIGAGSGHHAITLARMVGQTGHVYAVDINEPALLRLKKNARDLNLENVDILLRDVEREGTGLANGVADVAFLSNILSGLEDRTSVLREVSRILRRGGAVGVVDWTSKLTPNEVRRICEQEGFSFHRKFEAGEQHYGLIFRK